MSIASRIEAIEQHLTDDYSVLTLAGADLTNVDKNIVNLKPTWKERLLYFMNNGTQEVWDNWEKVVGEGTTITLNNTEEAPMKIVLKGNTSQETTTGKNLFNIEGQYETGTGITYTKNDDGSYTLNGTANGNNFLRGLCYLNEQHTISYTSNTVNSNVIIRTRTGTPTAQTGIQDQLFVSSTSGSLTSSKQFDFVEISIVNGTTLNNFKIYIQLEKGSSVTSFEPYTNGASPNPNYPQDIHVVSGDNSIEVCGKNLLNLSYLITANANNTYSGYGFLSFKLNVDLGQYTISRENNTMYNDGGYLCIGTGSNLNEAYTNKRWMMHPSISTLNVQKQIITNIGELWLFTSATQIGIDNMLLRAGYLQIEKGNQATTYEPYQSASYPINLGDIELCKIGTYQDKIDKSTGKNLVFSKIANENISRNGLLLIDNSFDMHIARVTQGETYTISTNDATNGFVGGFFYDLPMHNMFTYDNQRVVQDNNKTFTAPITGYVVFRSQAGYEYAQLEKGTQATTYEPYGTGWYVNKQIGKVVYTGASDESWNLVGSTFNWFAIRNDNIDTSNYTTTIKILCDYYKARTYANTINSGECTTYQNGAQHMFAIKNTDISSVENFKTWLSSNNTTVYYVLNTPTYTLIEDTTLINQLETIKKSYEGQTNITQENNDMPFILDTTALKEM